MLLNSVPAGDWVAGADFVPNEAELLEELASMPAEAQLFYQQFPDHNPDASWNFILDLAEMEFGMTFADEGDGLTPRACIFHDTLFELYSADH